MRTTIASLPGRFRALPASGRTLLLLFSVCAGWLVVSRMTRPSMPPATVITWGEAAVCLEPAERPISTPTPIANSSTPMPAITVRVLPRPPPCGAEGGSGAMAPADPAW